MKKITQVLDAIREGDTDAGLELIQLVYEQLRMLAKNKMRGESPGHTLQATALVHEAWLRIRMTISERQGWESRAHFFAAAGEAMRRILIEYARQKHSLKRGGNFEIKTLDGEEIPEPSVGEQLIQVHEALDRLALEDPLAADLVKLRYFVGMSMDESASALGLKKRSAEAIWTYAKAWLFRQINGGNG